MLDLGQKAWGPAVGGSGDRSVQVGSWSNVGPPLSGCGNWSTAHKPSEPQFTPLVQSLTHAQVSESRSRWPRALGSVSPYNAPISFVLLLPVTLVKALSMTSDKS